MNNSLTVRGKFPFAGLFKNLSGACTIVLESYHYATLYAAREIKLKARERNLSTAAAQQQESVM